MKTKNILTWALFAAVLLAAGQALAEDRAGQSGLPPYEQVRLNAKRVEADPGLRNKWDVKGRRPASVTALRVDNLPQEILLKLGSDEDLADRPMKIKVSSQNGHVILEGVVNDSAERDLVSRKVARMDGVKKLENRLKLKTQESDLL